VYGQTFGPRLAHGTTQLCKHLFPEEVYVSVGLKADLAISSTRSNVNLLTEKPLAQKATA
jgi:hypothetical protein